MKWEKYHAKEVQPMHLEFDPIPSLYQNPCVRVCLSRACACVELVLPTSFGALPVFTCALPYLFVSRLIDMLHCGEYPNPIDTLSSSG